MYDSFVENNKKSWTPNNVVPGQIRLAEKMKYLAKLLAVFAAQGVRWCPANLFKTVLSYSSDRGVGSEFRAVWQEFQSLDSEQLRRGMRLKAGI